MKCRECHSKGVIHLKRRRADKLVGYIIPIRPYRCPRCDTHLWGLIRWRHQRSAYVGAVTFWAGITLLATTVLVNLVPTSGTFARTTPPPASDQAPALDNMKVQRSTSAAPETSAPSKVAHQRPAPTPTSLAVKVNGPGNAAKPVTFYATTDRVHLRKGAGRQYPSITILDSDRILPAVEPATGDWIRLRHFDTTGYVHRSLLRPASAPEVKRQQG